MIDKDETFPCPIEGCAGTVEYAGSHQISTGEVKTWDDVQYRCDTCKTFFRKGDSGTGAELFVDADGESVTLE